MLFNPAINIYAEVIKTGAKIYPSFNSRAIYRFIKNFKIKKRGLKPEAGNLYLKSKPFSLRILTVFLRRNILKRAIKNIIY